MVSVGDQGHELDRHGAKADALLSFFFCHHRELSNQTSRCMIVFTSSVTLILVVLTGRPQHRPHLLRQFPYIGIANEL